MKKEQQDKIYHETINGSRPMTGWERDLMSASYEAGMALVTQKIDKYFRASDSLTQEDWQTLKTTNEVI